VIWRNGTIARSDVDYRNANTSVMVGLSSLVSLVQDMMRGTKSHCGLGHMVAAVGSTSFLTCSEGD